MQRKLAGIQLSVLAAAALAACGGGGGSPGETHFPYTISLSTNKTELPVNVNWLQPSAGIYATYTAMLTAQVRIGNRAAPIGTPVQCNITRGLGDTAVLYRLDGEDDTETDENGNEYLVASRELALETGAEGFVTFHAHSGDKAGEVQVSCSATDPRDQRVLSAFQTITVGSTRQNVPARVRYEDQAGRYPLDPLGTNGNLANLPNSVDIRAYLTDDRSQAVSNTGAANLKVTIMNDGPGEPGYQARLLHGNRPAAREVDINTDYQGQAQFQLAAGNNPGPIIVRMLADRCDNNVANGTDDLCAIAAVTAIRAYSELPEGPLAPGADPLVVQIMRGSNVTFGLNATGGVPPYTWGQVPAHIRSMGLEVTPEGILRGRVIDGTSGQTFEVRITDAVGDSVRQRITLNIEEPPPPPPIVIPPPVTPPPVTPPPVVAPPTVVTSVSIGAPGPVVHSFAAGMTGGAPSSFTWSILPENRGNLPGASPLAPGDPDVESTTGIFRAANLDPGIYRFILTLTDTANPARRFDFNIMMTVGQSAGVVPDPVEMAPGSTSVVISSTQNEPKDVVYSFVQSVSGGTPPYTFSISTANRGNLPAGASINNAGVFRGVMNNGTYSFIITVTDATGAKYNFNIEMGIKNP